MMGLLKSFIKKVARSPVGKALDVLTVSVAHPVQVAKAIISPKTTVKQVTEKFFSQPVKKQVGQIVLGGAAIGATIAGGAAIGAAAKARTLAPAALKIGKSLIPSTVKGKVIAAVAAPVVIGAVSREPAKVAGTLAKAPSELAQFGGDIAGFAADPSLSSGKELLKESPLLAAATGLVIGGAVAKAGAPIIGGLLQKGAIEEQTEAIKEAGGKIVTQEVPATQQQITPQLPATERIVTTATTTSRKKRKPSKKALMPSVNQKVNVIVANKTTTTGIRNYLKREVLLN